MNTSAATTIYLGFGSNLWQRQMQLRCPQSTFLGVGRLPRFKFIINGRGYANVVETGNLDDGVYGLVYSLTQSDEDTLDLNEGVPYAYTKEILECSFWPTGASITPNTAETRNLLVYVDRQRTTPDKIQREYIYRMNMGIDDAIKEGVPEDYIQHTLRSFIPPLHTERLDEQTLQVAEAHARRFVDKDTPPEETH